MDVLGRQLRQGASQAQEHDRGTHSLLEHLQAAEQVCCSGFLALQDMRHLGLMHML